MTDQNDQKQVLALDVRPRSFGFAVFKGSGRLLDWGVRSFRSGVNAVKLPPSKKLLALVDEFSPCAIVIGKPEPGKNRKRAPLLATIRRVANYRRIPVIFIRRQTINRTFAEAEHSNYEI
jgi:RNase H-fold protein (predicted Holliday junction resolvase)